MQHSDPAQARTTTVCNRFILKIESQVKVKMKDTGNELYHQCCSNMYKHPRMHNGKEIRHATQDDVHVNAVLTSMIHG